MKSPPGVHRTTSRRDVLGGMLAAGAALAEARPARASGSLTFVSYGGSYGDSVEKYLLAPFRQKTGIAVSLGVNSTLAGLKVQIASGQSEWDLVEVAGGELERKRPGGIVLKVIK